MYWKTKRNKLSRYVFLLVGFAISLGCSTGFENIKSDHAAQTYTSLSQQGQFTKAAILSSMYDSASLQMKGPMRTSLMDSEKKPPSEVKEEVNSALKAEQLPSPIVSPLQAYLPSDHAQKTNLDEKWHTELGWSLLIDGKYEGAVAAYREALRQNREIAEAYLGLGISLRMQNQTPAAIEAYQHALQLKPDYAAALVHLGYIYADGEPEHRNVEKAKHLFHQASQQGDPFAMIALRELKTRQ